MKRTTKAVAGLAAGTVMAAGLSLATVVPAQAADVDYWSADNQLRGTGYFNADPGDYRDAPGDAIRACDWLADGYGIEAQLDVNVATVPGPFHADRTISTAGHQAGSSGYCTGWKAKDIDEGTFVALRVCKVKDGTRSCGRPMQLVA